jgi:hypothetical protein
MPKFDKMRVSLAREDAPPMLEVAGYQDTHRSRTEFLTEAFASPREFLSKSKKRFSYYPLEAPVLWTVMLVFGVSLISGFSIFFPAVLADNTFLMQFVTFEIMSFLVVILTITFASVANIHLSISRTQTLIKDASTREKIENGFAKPLREETKSSAWLLFWALCVCAVALFVKGEWPGNKGVVSMVHGVGILVLVTNAVVLYDIYGTIFALVGTDTGHADFTEDSPRAGQD